MQRELMATLISVYPFEINEAKPCVYPGTFRIPAADKEVQHLIIGEAFHFVDRVDAPPLKIRLLPQELAKSIVEDWALAHLGVDFENGIAPGFFWVEGAHDKVEVVFADKILDYKNKQRLWFRELVKIGDDDWSRYHKHTAISDIQRYAAVDLKLEREWLIKASEVSATKECPGCRTFIDSRAIVCAHCGLVLNQVEYAKFQFAGVK